MKRIKARHNQSYTIITSQAIDGVWHVCYREMTGSDSLDEIVIDDHLRSCGESLSNALATTAICLIREHKEVQSSADEVSLAGTQILTFLWTSGV